MERMYQHSIDRGVFILREFSSVHLDKMIENHNELYRIFWVRQGMETFTIDGFSISIKGGQLLFLTPLHNVDHSPETPNVVGIGWNREFYCIRDNDLEVGCDGLLFYGSSQLTLIDLEVDDRLRFEGLLELIEEELNEQDGIQEEMLRVLLKRWLLLSARLYKRSLPEPVYDEEEIDICRRFNIEVEKNFRSLHRVSDYASLLYKSPKTLSNLFTKYGKKTPRQMINERIVLEAKRLARYSTKAVNEIAFDLGFEDPGHFSRLFKRNVGLSVSQFRTAMDP